MYFLGHRLSKSSPKKQEEEEKVLTGKGMGVATSLEAGLLGVSMNFHAL